MGSLGAGRKPRSVRPLPPGFLTSSDPPLLCLFSYTYIHLLTSCNSTLIVLFIVDILFDYAILLHPHTCDGSDLLRLPLPCGRDLWQARSRSDWQREYALKAAGKQLTYGDLLDSRFRTDRTLDSWLEQLDDFGTLVMAAASLGDG
jgi:hypothetical protein